MEDRLRTLSRYRYEAGEEALADARLMYEHGRYKNSLNRAYYAIFHAMRAVNCMDGFDSSKHSGVIAHFNQRYVKEGYFPRELSRIIRLASENREKADYLDFFAASREEAEKQIDRAEEFLKEVKKYLVEGGIM